jgi:hypothetical protein
MEEEPNSGTLEGTTEPTVVDAGRVFVDTGQNFPVQKNAAAKVIGILVMIYYVVGTGLSFLGLVALSFLDEEMIAAGAEPLPATLLFALVIIGLIPAIIGCIGGWKMYNYEKMGIWLVLGSLGIGWILSIVNGALTSDYGGTGDAGIDAAFNGICGIFCIAICGVIVAIPLMLADGGME